MLEIGPGVGQVSKLFTKTHNVTVVENSPKMAEIIKTIPDIKVIPGDIMTMDFPNQFDLIYIDCVLHCFPKTDAEILLQKIKTWMRDEDSLLYATTSQENKSTEGLKRKHKRYKVDAVRYRARYTKEEFRQMLERQFKIIDAQYDRERNNKKLYQCYLCKSI